MRNHIKVVLLSLLALLSPLSAYSWNAYGHMVVADIAYQNLTATAKQNIDFLVSELHQQYPNLNSFPEIACWPDLIRGQRIETYTHWHYIDIAISTDGTPVKNEVDTDNAAWAVTNIEPVVKNVHANPYERARFLSFLAHIVGDLHQPLHTVSNYTAATPNGDRGGNSYSVKYKGNKTNLHKLWDSGVGAFEGDIKAVASAQTTADDIMSKYPESYFNGKASDLKPDSWVKEGNDNATRYVYTTAQNQEVTQSYIDTGKSIAEQEAALAGYRLAKLLNQYLG